MIIEVFEFEIISVDFAEMDLILLGFTFVIGIIQF